MKIIVFSVSFLLLLAVKVDANVCLNAVSVEEMKRDFPVVVLGKILKKTEVPNSNGGVMLSIEVVRFIKGNGGAKAYEALTFERFPESERPTYKVDKLYVFPVERYNKKTKGKEYDIIVPSQGCKIIPVEPK